MDIFFLVLFSRRVRRLYSLPRLRMALYLLTIYGICYLLLLRPLGTRRFLFYAAQSRSRSRKRDKDYINNLEEKIYMQKSADLLDCY